MLSLSNGIWLLYLDKMTAFPSSLYHPLRVCSTSGLSSLLDKVLSLHEDEEGKVSLQSSKLHFTRPLYPLGCFPTLDSGLHETVSLSLSDGLLFPSPSPSHYPSCVSRYADSMIGSSAESWPSCIHFVPSYSEPDYGPN